MSLDLDDLESLFQGWDRTFLDFSSKMSEPFCAAWHLLGYRLVAPLDPQKFEACTHVVNEVAIRILIGLGAGLGGLLIYIAPLPILGSIIGLGIISKVFRAIGFTLQKGGYTHIRGKAAENPLNLQDPQVKVMSWNICGLGGGMSLDHGGVIHWHSRLEKIVEKIKTENPDVLILQEVYDAALAEALAHRLKSDYAHFFIHMGPNVWGSVGGCMVLSKGAVHNFSYTPFKNNKWSMNRGFASLELKATPQELLPCVRIIGTHFIHGQKVEDKKNRADQLAQIVNHVARQAFPMVAVLAGDLNIERDGEEGVILSSCLHHGYQGPWATCTNRLNAKWHSKIENIEEETIDYVSLFKSTLSDGSYLPVVDKEVTLKAKLVEAFDNSPNNTQTATSDHHGLSALIQFKAIERKAF